MSWLKPKPSSVVGKENPATVQACQADYGTPLDAAMRSVDQAEQRGQTRTNGNAGGGFWRGRK